MTLLFMTLNFGLRSMPPVRNFEISRSLLMQVFLLASLGSVSAWSAEDELTLLSIEGNLIGKIAALDPRIQTEQLIHSYYLLLPDALRTEVESLRRQLIDLMPFYEVAFTAADSAEITEVKSDIDVVWAGIRTVHAQNFTPEVSALLNAAYDSAFSSLRLGPTPAPGKP